MHARRLLSSTDPRDSDDDEVDNSDDGEVVVVGMSVVGVSVDGVSVGGCW